MRIEDWQVIAGQRMTAVVRDAMGSVDEHFTEADAEAETVPHLGFFWRAGPVDPSQGFQDRQVAAFLQLVVAYDAAPGVNKVVQRDGERVIALFEDAHTWIGDGTCFAVICGSWIPGPSRTRINGIECTMDLRVEYALTGV